MNWIARSAARSTKDVLLIGVRGLYAPNGNKRGIYDDALVWVQKSTGLVSTYSANVDPSAFRKGRGNGSSKGMASLKNGVWLYKPGIHKGYPAFIQDDVVTVIRDGLDGDYEETGFFGINIHRGGVNGTNSLGCQTTKCSEWPEFKELGYRLLKEAAQENFNYILIGRDDAK